MPQDLSRYGDARFTTVRELEPGGRAPGVYCVYADPKIRIGAELIAEWHEAKVPDGRGGFTAITLGQFGASVLVACTGHPEHTGDLITIDCSDRRLLYRVTAHDFATDAYFAEWPD